jgi:hypothetical protein
MPINHHQRSRFRQALLRVAGDEQMLITLSEIVSSDAPALINQLDLAVADGDAASVARTAHALKGLLSSFETGDPTDRLQPIIDAARVGDMDEVTLLYGRARAPIESLLKEIDSLSAAQTSDST